MWYETNSYMSVYAIFTPLFWRTIATEKERTTAQIDGWIDRKIDRGLLSSKRIHIEYISCGRRLDIMNVELNITFNFTPCYFSFNVIFIIRLLLFLLFLLLLFPHFSVDLVRLDRCQHANFYLCPFSCLSGFKAHIFPATSIAVKNAELLLHFANASY